MKEAAGTLEALDVDQDGRVGFYNGLSSRKKTLNWEEKFVYSM